MSFPTWGQLLDNFCSNKNNIYYEDFATRRYNYAASSDRASCRLIFLKDVLESKENKTLRRRGRFIWCRKLKYEGKDEKGFRKISFTVDKGQKRFFVSENNILCLPSSVCISNSRFYKSKQKLFFPFSSVFSYKSCVGMMVRNSSLDRSEFTRLITEDNPYKPGTLVVPRMGYFHPDINPNKIGTEIHSEQDHPCGIILGPCYSSGEYVTREMYRVRFGDTTYEKVHPVQLEIVNEV